MFTQQCRTTSKAICEFSKVTHKEQEIDIFVYGTGSQHFKKTSLIRIFSGFGKVYLFSLKSPWLLYMMRESLGSMQGCPLHSEYNNFTFQYLIEGFKVVGFFGMEGAWCFVFFFLPKIQTSYFVLFVKETLTDRVEDQPVIK